METDEELIARFVAGDPSAFASLYQRYLTRVQRFVQTSGASWPDAEDVTQEAFIDLHRNARSFDAGKGSFRAWLFTLARNRWISFCRKRKLPIASDEDSAAATPDPRLTPSGEAEKTDEFRRLWHCVGQLAPKQRVVMEMTLQEMSPDEIAQVLNIPVGTVYGRQHHARPLLRKCLSGQ